MDESYNRPQKSGWCERGYFHCQLCNANQRYCCEKIRNKKCFREQTTIAGGT